MAPQLSGLLPDRSVVLRHHGFADRIQLPFLEVTLASMAPGTLVAAGPGLNADNRIRRDPVEVPDALIANGQCMSRKFTFHCKLQFAYRQGFKQRSRQVDLLHGAGTARLRYRHRGRKGHPRQSPSPGPSRNSGTA